MFARREGTDPDALPVYVGSHLDTQPTGGKYDGVLGVLGALEAVRSMNDLGIQTKHPIVVVNWANEEGARFAPAMLASGVFAGVHSQDYAYGRTDLEGKSYGEELVRIGWKGDEDTGARKMHAYFELHIEQGPILDAEKRQVGIVTGGYPVRGMRASFAGQTSHTGPTPMDLRKNALAAGARWLTAVDDIGWDFAVHDGKATAARLTAWPNKAGILSDTAEAVCDVRHPDPITTRVMAEKMRRALYESAARCGCEARIEDEWEWGGDIFDQEMIDGIRDEAIRMEFNWRDIESQAGHDAYFLATHCPTAMIFTPWRRR